MGDNIPDPAQRQTHVMRGSSVVVQVVSALVSGVEGF